MELVGCYNKNEKTYNDDLLHQTELKRYCTKVEVS